jgi:hypothetical protein
MHSVLPELDEMLLVTLFLQLDKTTTYSIFRILGRPLDNPTFKMEPIIYTASTYVRFRFVYKFRLKIRI